MISFIIPFHNEKENIPLLLERLHVVLKDSKEKYEIVLVDDGSVDGYELPAQEEKSVHLVTHGKRLGKGRALESGFKKSNGDIIILMDADLQDNPEDVPHLLKKLDGGYDLVNGVRETRNDNGIVKFYSGLGNAFLQAFAKSPFTDINCGFKAFKRRVLDDFVLYGNNFRFLPLAAYLRGYRVAEIPVKNSSRIHGTSKFGKSKVFVGFVDTITAYFLYEFSEKPLHFFGLIGGILFIVGSIITGWLTVERLFFGVELYKRPLLLAGVFLVMVGLQIGMTGVLGELIVYLHKKKV